MAEINPEHPGPVEFSPRERLRWAIELLRLPAGDDPRFSNPESIGAHRDDFVVEVHTTRGRRRFVIDEPKITADAQYDGKWVLRTNTD